MPPINEATERTLPTRTETTASSLEGGRAYVADMARRLGRYCVRAPSRQRVMAAVHGLLREAQRQQSWHVAEAGGAPTPYGFPYVLARAAWDAALVRAARRTDISQQRGDPHGVLVRDATGLVHKGRHAAGVARQDTGTVGPVAHGHIGVCLSSAGPLGHALVERERSLPNEGTDDRARCGQAGIPAERPCATPPPRARQRWARGGPATGVTGDRVSGDDRRRRLWVAAQPPPDGWAVSGQAYGGLGWPQRQGKRRLATVPEDGWTRLSAGDGAQGPRWSDGHWRSLTAPLAPGGCRWWLVRRRVSAPTDMTADVVFAPQVTTRPAVVGGAGSRWTMESGVEEATGAVGRDHDAVRSWTGWSRHLARALWALALLTSIRAGTSTGEACKKRLQPPSEAHPLAAFQARRGLASRGAAPHGEGGSGGESWPCRRRPVISSAGHPGVGGTKPSPHMTTISVVRPWWRPWQHNPSCYHCSYHAP